MSWTDERIETLKKLWGEGHSASQIAAELGGVSRNAVIGKVHRLKLESRIKAPAPQAAAPVAVAPAPAVPAPAAAAPIVSKAPEVQPAAVVRNAAPVAEFREAPATPRILPAQAAAPHHPMARTMGATALKMEPALVVEEERRSADVLPISRNLTLVQLSERTCKWPLGDPLSPDFRFCGNSSGEGSPYCKYHARIAFQPASERRRVR